MTAATAMIANETEIKQAMGVLGLGGLVDDLLDEIELDRELTIGMEQLERGEGIPLEEVEKRVKANLESGYYARNRR